MSQPASTIPAAAEWLTTEQVAAMFRVNPTGIRRWVRRGLFPDGTVTRGQHGELRFDRAAVNALLGSAS